MFRRAIYPSRLKPVAKLQQSRLDSLRECSSHSRYLIFSYARSLAGCDAKTANTFSCNMDTEPRKHLYDFFGKTIIFTSGMLAACDPPHLSGPS